MKQYLWRSILECCSIGTGATTIISTPTDQSCINVHFNSVLSLLETKTKRNLSLALLGNLYLHYVYRKLSVALLFVTMTFSVCLHRIYRYNVEFERFHLNMWQHDIKTSACSELSLIENMRAEVKHVWNCHTQKQLFSQKKLTKIPETDGSANFTFTVNG